MCLNIGLLGDMVYFYKVRVKNSVGYVDSDLVVVCILEGFF